MLVGSAQAGTMAEKAFQKMCVKRDINPEGQFAQEDGYLFYDGYEAGVRDTHKACNIERSAQIEACLPAILKEALDKVEHLVHVCDQHDDRVKARQLSEPMRKLWEAINGPA